MKYFVPTLALIILLSCGKKEEISSINPNNWIKRSVNKSLDSLKNGTTYLSIYSEIYSENEHKTHNLTATVSMRNISSNDTIFISEANYYNTHGELIRSYLNHSIFIAPLETVEIVIDEVDLHGGTGANFLFKWKIDENTPTPYFEGIMISTSGQQGLSFTTRGVRIN